MSETTGAALLSLVSGRRGHFLLESGHHGGLWLDLDALFADPIRIAPFVSALSDALRPHRLHSICGPLLGGAFLAQAAARELGVEFSFTERAPVAASGGLYQARYQLPRAFASRLDGKRVGIVDDVMSAGSALRGSHSALLAHGAKPVVVGALLILGDVGVRYFEELGVTIVAVAREEYGLWTPGDCPMCAAGEPLEEAAAPMA